jgi:ABC-type sugar transport system substrate-binding protein
MRNVHAIARRHVLAAVAGMMVLATVPAAAQDKVQDKVKVGVFPVSSSLPYFVRLSAASSRSRTLSRRWCG